ncbi:MAG: hypothetical protein EOO85_30095 [Pedobacter sp.]|nr:MAG: hypothetical protein EOO85_30095 [Pedobacter sp.]
MDFVQPVEDAERDLAEVLGFMESSGRLMFLFGRPGLGKSTFVQSLTWRTQLLVSHLEQFDASKYPIGEALDQALSAIRGLALVATKKADLGTVVLVINYLENLDGVPVDTVRGFFRTVNGLLRNNRILIIWPVTSRNDVNKMMSEDKLTDIRLPEGATIDWGGVPVNWISQFFNSEMRGFTVYADFDKLDSNQVNRFVDMWQSCSDGLGITIKNADDWSFNPNNIADVESCSVNYQRYFKDNKQMQAFLDEMYTEMMKNNRGNISK